MRKEREAEKERLRKQQEEQARIQANINRPWRELLKKTLSAAKKNSYGSCSVGRSNFKLHAWDCGDSDLYCGWYDDKGNQEGLGMYLWDDGSCYVGQWKNHDRHGEGCYYDENGKLEYKGKYFNDKKVGDNSAHLWQELTFGVINYENGDKYVGELKDGKKHGQGLYLWINGGVWYGKWYGGKRDGYGIYISNSGNYSIGSWDGDTKER